MALITCHECGQQISSTAKACPSCGAKPKKPTSRIVIGIGILALIFILNSVFTGLSAEGSAKAKPPPDPAAESEFQQVVGALQFLKKRLKNPASFELAGATMTADRTLCIQYRGTNSYGATITSRYAISDTISSDSAADWNQHCAGRTGKDYMHARYALR